VSKFSSVPGSLFFTKNDPQDLRLGDIVKSKTAEELVVNNSFAVLGYPDHEGIKLNGGRIGAAEGPQKVREFLYKMTPPVSQNLPVISDLGDLSLESPLDQRHEAAKETVYKLHQKQQRVISIGGGHDYGYADGAAFVQQYKNSKYKPVVLNFDAHLDVRPAVNGFNSGTPFYRLLSEFAGHFSFAEIGIQPQCNSPHHRQWALENGAHIFDLSDIQKGQGLASLWNHDLFRNLNSETPLFISFDIDGITSSEGGGCSQSWATGLGTQDYLNFFHQLKTQADIRALGIYEVAPSLDTDNRTSKIAALLAYHFIMQDLL
jgi:formiminoglutamase